MTYRPYPTPNLPGWFYSLKSKGADFLGGLVAKMLPSAGGPGSIPTQGTRSHMLQLRVYMP